jgi:hypothetical protein
MGLTANSHRSSDHGAIRNDANAVFLFLRFLKPHSCQRPPVLQLGIVARPPAQEEFKKYVQEFQPMHLIRCYVAKKKKKKLLVFLVDPYIEVALCLCASFWSTTCSLTTCCGHFCENMTEMSRNKCFTRTQRGEAGMPHKSEQLGRHLMPWIALTRCFSCVEPNTSSFF